MFPFRKRFLGIRSNVQRRSTIACTIVCHCLIIMPPRRRLRNELIDDEAEEDHAAEERPAQRTFTGSPYRPLNLSAFGGRPSPQAARDRDRFHVTLRVTGKRGLVKVKMINSAGHEFSEPLNQVMREMEDDDGYVGSD